VVADIPVGEMIWETRYSPIKGPDGIVVEVVGVSFDVTEQRRNEISNRQSQKLEAVGRLAGGVAHDFNNMLTVIIGAAQELGFELKHQPHLAGLSSTILCAADRAAKLTRQLLMLARNAPSEASPVVADAIVQESVGLLRRSIDRRVRISTKLGAGSAVVVVDAGQLQNSILNLGLNARDAMPGGGDLVISTDIVELDGSASSGMCAPLVPGAYLRISVTDCGVGIAPDIVSRVFDPFFTTKEVGKGTGLGLAMVYGTARAHGGTVTVDSEPGRGSIFCILLPVAPDAAPGMEPRQRPVSPGTGLVLLVEDEPLVRQTGKMLLTSLGYDVVTAGDGTEGLSKFNKLHNNLVAVLCDVVMPGMSGPDAVQLMKQSDPDVPVVMCSGYASTKLEVAQIGDVEVIAKPYSREDLGSILSRLARQL
jgi:nitrogen-specific signal transduction histidine kinase/CheY-like chemotaxis protein